MIPDNIYIKRILSKEVKKLKRIISACVELTVKFENEQVYKKYLNFLERRRIKYRIIDNKTLPDNEIIIKIIKSYNNYSVGDYLN